VYNFQEGVAKGCSNEQGVVVGEMHIDYSSQLWLVPRTLIRGPEILFAGQLR